MNINIYNTILILYVKGGTNSSTLKEVEGKKKKEILTGDENKMEMFSEITDCIYRALISNMKIKIDLHILIKKKLSID